MTRLPLAPLLYGSWKLAYKPAEANNAFGVLCKMLNLAEVWGYRPDGTNPCRHVPMYPPGEETRRIVDDELALIFRHLGKLEVESGFDRAAKPPF